MAGEDEFHDDNQPPQHHHRSLSNKPLHSIQTIKLYILKKGEYDIWAMKIEHYLSHIDYPIWEVIQKGNGPVNVSTDTNGQIKVLPPKTAEEIFARERERKARTTLLMPIPKDHLAKFHKMNDAKDMWEAIKSRFCGNDESKKMQKYILKQQFESFSISNSEGLHKGYDRTKPGVDTLSFDDLYNNLKVFKSDVKGSTVSSSSIQNVAFVSSESTSSTNDVSTAYGVSTSSGYNSQRENSSSYTDELMYSFFANQSSGPQLDHEDLDGEDAGSTGYKAKDNKRRPKKQEEPKALVTLDGDGVDWTGYAEDEQENFALMAYNNSRSDTDVTSCSKECVEAYAKLKKIYDEQREQLGDASIEIKAYTLALAKKLLAEAVKEKEELKINLKNFQSSSKGLSKLLKSQMSAKDKSGLGLQMLKGMHAVPSPMTGNNMPQKSDFGIDELNFTYGQKQSKTSESTANTSDFDSCKSNSRSMSQVKQQQTKFWEKTSNRTTAPKANFANNKVNTAGDKTVSAVRGNRETAIKALAGCNWRSKRYYWNKDDPQKALKNKGIVDSGSSRHITRNKAYLIEYQDYNEIEEGEGSEQPTEPQPTPSPTQPSIGDQPYVTDSSSGSDNTHSPSINLGGTGGIHWGSDVQVLALETFKDAQAAKIIKLKTRINKLEKKCKPNISHHKAWLKRPTLDDFDDLDADLAHGMDYMDTEEAVTEGTQSKEIEELVLLVKIYCQADSRCLVTATPMTPPTTTSVFEDEDIFLADALVMLSDKAKLKGVEIKEMNDAERPARSVSTLKPLLRIDPKDKGKGVLEEEPKLVKVKSKDQGEAQIDKDAKIALKVQAKLDEEARLERQRQEQVSMNYIASLYDEVQARIDADHELALAEERAAAIKNKPPTRSQLRSLMMTYLKHTSRYKHAQLNKKTLEEIQVLYIKEHERIADFVPIGSERDERMIEKMNRMQLVYMRTKKSRMQKRDFDLEEEEHLKTFLKLVPDEEEIIDYEGDLRTMFDTNAEDDIWKNQEEWILRSWNFYENCWVHTLILEDDTEIHMLAERKYSLTKETLKRMLSLKLIAEFASESAYNLLRFIQKQIDEYGSYDGREKDL
ncbi:hypothetical protein Tco_0196189 [Tanacetum coccineum]